MSGTNPHPRSLHVLCAHALDRQGQTYPQLLPTMPCRQRSKARRRVRSAQTRSTSRVRNALRSEMGYYERRSPSTAANRTAVSPQLYGEGLSRQNPPFLILSPARFCGWALMYSAGPCLHRRRLRRCLTNSFLLSRRWVGIVLSVRGTSRPPRRPPLLPGSACARGMVQICNFITERT